MRAEIKSNLLRYGGFSERKSVGNVPFIGGAVCVFHFLTIFPFFLRSFPSVGKALPVKLAGRKREIRSKGRTEERILRKRMTLVN